jgi:hypothetical protein
MTPNAWSNERQRQFQHIKKNEVNHGRWYEVAEEIAARTVNKERARKGETLTSSRTSTDDISFSRRGRLRSHRGPGGRAKKQLYEEARRKNIRWRFQMNRSDLEKAVDKK